MNLPEHEPRRTTPLTLRQAVFVVSAAVVLGTILVSWL